MAILVTQIVIYILIKEENLRKVYFKNLKTLLIRRVLKNRLVVIPKRLPPLNHPLQKWNHPERNSINCISNAIGTFCTSLHFKIHSLIQGNRSDQLVGLGWVIKQVEYKLKFVQRFP